MFLVLRFSFSPVGSHIENTSISWQKLTCFFTSLHNVVAVTNIFRSDSSNNLLEAPSVKSFPEIAQFGSLLLNYETFPLTRRSSFLLQLLWFFIFVTSACVPIVVITFNNTSVSKSCKSCPSLNSLLTFWHAVCEYLSKLSKKRVF